MQTGVETNSSHSSQFRPWYEELAYNHTTGAKTHDTTLTQLGAWGSVHPGDVVIPDVYYNGLLTIWVK